MASYKGFTFVSALNQGGPEIVSGLKEANSQSFKAGALVYVSSGTVTVLADGGSGVGTQMNTDLHLCGIALKDATNVSSGNIEIPFIKIRPGDMFEAWVYTLGSTDTAADTNIGLSYDIDITSSHSTVDLNDTTNPIFTIHKHLESGTKVIGTFTPLASYLFYN